MKQNIKMVDGIESISRNKDTTWSKGQVETRYLLAAFVEKLF